MDSTLLSSNGTIGYLFSINYLWSISSYSYISDLSSIFIRSDDFYIDDATVCYIYCWSK